MDNTIKISFNISSQKEMRDLGYALGTFFRNIYDNGKFITEHSNNSEKNVLTIGISGEPAAGKSTLSSNLLYSILLDEYDDYYGATVTFRDCNRPSMAWQSYWSTENNMTNRNFDCILEGPYPCGERIIVPSWPPMPDRKMGGIDIIEHPDTVPEELILSEIHINITANNCRLVDLTIKDTNDFEKTEINKVIKLSKHLYPKIF